MEAGVNIATLHYYFKNKESLLSEVVDYAVERTLGQLRAAIQETPDAASALERAFQMTWEMVKQRPGVLRYDLVVRGMRNPDAHQQAARIYRALYSLVGEILDRHTASGNALRPDVTRDVLEHYLVAAIDGVILQHLVFGDDEKTRGCLQLILQHTKMLLMTGTTADIPLRESTNEI
jgi:AcrR family transcriptional regulator